MLSLLERANLPRIVDPAKLSTLDPRHSPIRHLSRTELATIRVTVPDPSSIPEDDGGVCAVAHRLASWGARGALSGRSGWSIAASLQELVWVRSHGWQKPLRGLELLRLLDATSDQHGVTITVDLLGQQGYSRHPLGLL